MRYIVFIVLPMFLYSVSFDCSKANSRVEHKICSSQTLSFLDDTMYYVYHYIKSKIKRTNPYMVSQFIEQQKEWLKSSRNLCETDDCLVQSYISRINKMIFHFINPAPSPEDNNVYLGYCHLERSLKYSQCIQSSGWNDFKMRQCVYRESQRVREYSNYLEARIQRMLKYGIETEQYQIKSPRIFQKMIDLHKQYRHSRCELLYPKLPGTLDMLMLNECYLEEDYRWLFELKNIIKNMERDLD